jgi:hypothetical protein
MARPRKKPIESEVIENIDTIEELITETAEIEEVKSVEFSDDIELIDDEELDNLSPEDDYVPGELYYEVFDTGMTLGYCKDGSEELMKFINGNKEELQNWVNELKTEITDHLQLLSINYPGAETRYVSVLQYQNQNGFAPEGPKFKSMMDYYIDQHPTSSEEEIAFAVFGNLRFSFVPVRL